MVVYTTVQTVATIAEPEDVWKAAERAVHNSRWYSFPAGRRRRRSTNGWSVADRKPFTTLRLRARMRAPGRAWLEITVTPQDGGGSRYTQRSIFFPSVIPGRLYWFMVQPLHAAALRALARDVLGSAH